MDLADLNNRLEKIEQRNQKVENNKSWETSKTRLFFISIITYLVAGSYMYIIGSKDAPLGALIPVMGFLLSTLALPPLKQYWIKNIKK